MVILTHSTKYSGRSSPKIFHVQLSPTSRSNTRQNYQKPPANHGRIFSVVTFFLISALLIKFIVEFKIQERFASLKDGRNIKISAWRDSWHSKPDHLTEGSWNITFSQVQLPENNSLPTSYDSEFLAEILATPSPNSLLNITKFQWIRNNVSICKVNVSPFTKLLPVLIHTSRGHFLERQSIRDTWASFKNYRNWSVRPVFLIGQSNHDNLADANVQKEERSLDEEHQVYGDIITGNFIDSYRNLTYKHMMGYKWIVDHCAEASFVLKTDDDMFIDVLEFIDKRENKDADIFCNVFSTGRPIRSNNSKWYVSDEEWSEQTYPTYCSGWGYGITVDWVSKMYLMSSQTKYFWVDDVFTGILMNMAESFFRMSPKIQPINELYTFDNKLYIDMCRNNSGDWGMLRTANRKFGAVVFVNRNDNFEIDMACLWNKALLDKKLI